MWRQSCVSLMRSRTLQFRCGKAVERNELNELIARHVVRCFSVNLKPRSCTEICTAVEAEKSGGYNRNRCRCRMRSWYAAVLLIFSLASTVNQRTIQAVVMRLRLKLRLKLELWLGLEIRPKWNPRITEPSDCRPSQAIYASFSWSFDTGWPWHATCRTVNIVTGWC